MHWPATQAAETCQCTATTAVDARAHQREHIRPHLSGPVEGQLPLVLVWRMCDARCRQGSTKQHTFLLVHQTGETIQFS